MLPLPSLLMPCPGLGTEMLSRVFQGNTPQSAESSPARSWPPLRLPHSPVTASLSFAFFLSFLTTAVLQAKAFERYLCNNSPPPMPGFWRPGRLASGDLVGNGSRTIANGPFPGYNSAGYTCLGSDNHRPRGTGQRHRQRLGHVTRIVLRLLQSC